MELTHALGQAVLLILFDARVVPLLCISLAPGDDIGFVDPLCDRLSAVVHWMAILIDVAQSLFDSPCIGILVSCMDLVMGLCALGFWVEAEMETILFIVFDLFHGCGLARLKLLQIV